MKTLSCLFLLGVVLMLGSCVPEFENPLPCERVEADSRLLDDWRSAPNADDEQSRLAFHARSNGWYDIVFLTGVNRRSGTNGLECTIYEGFSTRVNDRSFLCLRLRQRDFADRTDAPTNYRFLIAGYKVGRQNLAIRILSESKVRNLIEAGVLQGQSGQSHTGGAVVVTSAPEALRDAIGRIPDEDLLGEPMRFRRAR